MKHLIIIILYSILFVKIHCYAGTIIVDPTGLGDFTKIQDAINASWHGDIVIVRPSTYQENINFNGKAIILTSQDPNDLNTVESTIITANTGYSVVFEWSEGLNSKLIGFKITGKGIRCSESSPTIAKNVICNINSSAISGSSNSHPDILNNKIFNTVHAIGSCMGEIKNNVITNNSGYGLGNCDGSISYNVISNNTFGLSGCDGTISHNTITNNTQPDPIGGAGLRNCNGTISNNIISNNSYNYGGSSNESSGGLYGCDGEIINNLIENNYSRQYGGALRECHGTIQGNIIIGNISSNTGGGLYNCDSNIINNVIVSNRAISGFGGGLADCKKIIKNNTIVSNQAENGGGLIGCDGSVQNNIIAFNTATSCCGGISSPYNGSYNAFWMNIPDNLGGAAPGVGDIVVDPLFADSQYHLKSQAGRWEPNSETWVVDSTTSHCIDAGDPCDSIGYEPNPNGGRINMGAYGSTWQASKSIGGTGPEPPARCLEYPTMDFNKDCKVDFQDFAIFCQSWLKCNFDPPHACLE